MATPTVEQYLKTIFLIERRSGESVVAMKTLADSMGVTAGTATAMAKHLAGEGLIDYQPRRGTALTAGGRSLAVDIVRRHRLIETFLERALGYDWSEVHQEAEELEHVVSDLFVERIDALLGYPTADPHGDPIPRADGRIAQPGLLSLRDATVDTPHEVTQLLDTDATTLHHMKEVGLVPGRIVRVVSANPGAGTLEVRSDRGAPPTILSMEAATLIRVTPVPNGPT